MKKFINIHTHFAIPKISEEEVKERLLRLKKKGLERMAVLCRARFGVNYDQMKALIPPRFLIGFSPTSLDHFPLLLDFTNKNGFSDMLIPFIDVRCLKGNVEKELESYSRKGIKGIKAFFLPKYDKILDLAPFPQSLGIATEDYYELQKEIISYGHKNHLPILYHVDLRENFELFREIYRSVEKAKIDIAHFGYSREKISLLMEEFENCYTDLADLVPAIAEKRESYIKFILSYQDRILFGTDGNWYSEEYIWQNVEFFSSLGLRQRVLDKILYENALGYLEK